MGEYQKLQHTFEPIYNQQSKVLILGSFPSVKSREQNFYYGHPRNRFWSLMGLLTGETCPQTIEQKKGLLLSHGIAIWDVIAQCDIIGSSDSSIKNVIPTDLKEILAVCPQIRIFANGAKAGELYRKYQQKETGISIQILPSTSPANAAFSLERLKTEWSRLLQIEK